MPNIVKRPPALLVAGIWGLSLSALGWAKLGTSGLPARLALRGGRA